MKAQFVDRSSIVCGFIFILAGGLFVVQSLELKLGTALRMGPGYFPLVLASVLMLLGIIIVLQSFAARSKPVGPIPWRGLAFILVAPVFFGLTLRGLGFVLSLFGTCVIASLASRRMQIGRAILPAALVTGFATLVFVVGLGLPFRYFGSWV